MEEKKVEGIIERIGYEHSAERAHKGAIYIVLVDDCYVYCSYEADFLYDEVTDDGYESALLLLTQKGDHIAFYLESNPEKYGDGILAIESYSLRNWTLENRLTHSLKDITPKDKGLPYPPHKLLSNCS